MKIITEIWNEIKNHQTIICLAHINPDGDAYASQISLALIIKKFFPKKNVVCYNDAASRFAHWNHFLETENSKTFKNALVLITDTATSKRINSKYWTNAKTIIKIDHHPEQDLFGKINWIDETSSSASQMIGNLALTLNLELTSEIADIIYTGIVSDTNRFNYPTVNETTFKVLAYLFTFNINLSKIYDKYYEQNQNILKLKAWILGNYHFSSNKKVVYCFLNYQVLKNLQVSAQCANEQVDLLANIETSKIWLIFSQNNNSELIFGVFRSNIFKVNEIAEKFGGGGHDHFAGATLQNEAQIKLMIEKFAE